MRGPAALTAPAARRAAWGVSAVSAGLLAAGGSGVVLGLSHSAGEPRDWLVGVAFTLVGARLAERRWENPIGWLFLAIGLSGALSVATEAGSSSPGLAWAKEWVWWPAYGLLPLALLLFPTGRLSPGRWRAIAWAGWLGLVATTVALAVAALHHPGDLLSGDAVRGAARPPLLVAGAGMVCTVAVGAAAVMGLVARCRRTRGDERQQCKWLLAGGAFATVAFGFELAGAPGAWVVGAAAVPVAAGVAILRHGLYDIDRLVHRAVAYAVVSAALAAVFVGAVVRLRTPVGALAGHSDLGIAGTTLAIAAVFRPFLRRVQAAVDRRFNRARFDAVATVDAFKQRMRDRVDLDELAADLLLTAEATMQPASATFWLRPAGGRILPPTATTLEASAVFSSSPRGEWHDTEAGGPSVRA